jgi:prolyl 4-hydroxylase
MEPAENLESAVDAGQSAAQYALGVKLLSGPDSSAHFERAVALIESSSAAGYAAATETCAIFEAMGVARAQSWDRAFDRLRSAAEQGSRDAQVQLLILARNDQEPVIPKAPAVDHWAKVRAAISIERLLRHPDRQSLCNSPRIRVIAGFATMPECNWLIARARRRLKPATVFKADGSQTVDPGRSNSGSEFLVLDMDVVLEIVRARIAAAARVPVPVFEPTQILHYAVGQEFKPHHDFLDPASPTHHDQLRLSGQRIATFLIYLNEDFEGGETDFPAAGIRYRGRAGDAVFWANLDTDGRPDPLTLHAGLPPTSGEKWILSQWIRDRVAMNVPHE